MVADWPGWWLFIRRWEQGLEILGEGGAKEIHSSRGLEALGPAFLTVKVTSCQSAFLITPSPSPVDSRQVHPPIFLVKLPFYPNLLGQKDTNQK